MVTHWWYQSPDSITSSNPYLSVPLSTWQRSTSGRISIECLVYFWICLTFFVIPFVLSHHTQPFYPCFIFSLKAVCPTRSFIFWVIPWRQLIHFSHGPTCLCLLLIHSFSWPTLIPVCSQIVLTFLIPFVSLIISFLGRCSLIWVNNRVDTSSHTSLLHVFK